MLLGHTSITTGAISITTGVVSITTSVVSITTLYETADDIKQMSAVNDMQTKLLGYHKTDEK